MRLKSNTREFYDWAAHNGDNHLTWVRTPESVHLGKINPLDMSGDLLQFFQVAYASQKNARKIERPKCHIFSGEKYYTYTHGVFYVGNRMFAVAYPGRFDEHPDLAPHTTTDNYGLDSEYCLARLCGAPVGFIYRAWDGYHVDRNPRIGDVLGLVGLLPEAQQLVQEIEYTLGNRMKDSPDQSPVDKRTDKEKIVSAGFDVKQSFRHRK